MLLFTLFYSWLKFHAYYFKYIKNGILNNHYTFDEGGTKLYFMHYFCVVIILFTIGLCKSAQITNNTFVIIVCKVGVSSTMYFCSYLFETTGKKKRLTEGWLQLLKENMPLGSFLVLKIQFIKKCGTFTKWKSEKTPSINLRSRNFLWTSGISSIEDNWCKMQTSFKTLVSKNRATWWFHRTSG